MLNASRHRNIGQGLAYTTTLRANFTFMDRCRFDLARKKEQELSKAFRYKFKKKKKNALLFLCEKLFRVSNSAV